ncbi:hypothetical protein CDO44_05655 [Pigmentiphaga sp. NML080357]|nr:hypothetical protein CDO44_05655 [Pigmentiphaga sp. NML080357]
MWGLKVNKTYRTVWSHRLGCWVAVAETARAQGKRNAGRAGAVAVALMAGVWAAPASADGMHGIPGLANARLTEGAAVGVMSQMLQAATNAAPAPVAAPAMELAPQAVSQTAAALAGLSAPVMQAAPMLQQVPIAEAPPSVPVVREALAAVPVPALETIASVPSKAVEAVASAPARVAKVASSAPAKVAKTVASAPARVLEKLVSAPAKTVEAVASAPATVADTLGSVPAQTVASIPSDPTAKVFGPVSSSTPGASVTSLASVSTALSNTLSATPASSLASNVSLNSMPMGGSLLPSSSSRQAAAAAVSGSEPPPLNPAPPTGLVIGTAGLLGGVGQGLQPLTLSLFGQQEAWLRSGALSVNRENINARFRVVNVLGVPVLDLAPVTGTLQGTLGGSLPEQKLTLLGGVTSGNYITNINSGLTYNNGLLLPGTDAPSWVDRNNCLNVLGIAGATCWDIPAAQNNQVLIGDGASANGSQEVVIGTNAKHILPNENASDIFTDPNMPGVPDTNYAARKGHSVLIGDSTYGNANGQTILGASASSTVAGGVALGFQSVSDREGGGTERFSNVAVPVRGAVSVGSAGNERQITNVAGGTAATDAVNVRQLQAVADQIGTIDGNSVKYDDDTKTKVTLAGTGGTVVTNVKAGAVNATSTDAVNGSQLNETNTNITNVDNRVTNVDNRITNIDNSGTKYFKANSTLAAASAAGTDSVAAGGASVASAANAVALGNGANASMANSVALGAGSTTTVGAQADYVAYALAARQSSAGEVSVGSAGATRRITNLSAGSADTDAVNIAQLKAVDSRIGDVDKLAVKYDDDSKTKITLNPGGGGTVIANLGPGAVTSSSTEAINGSQLWGWTQDETNVMSNLSLYKRINDIDVDTKYFKANSTLAAAQANGTNSVAAGPAAVSGGTNSVAMGNGATTSADNSVAVGGASAASGTASTAVGSEAKATGAQSTAMGSGSTASGSNSTAVGTGSKATGTDSTAIGANSEAKANNSVALGAGSVADRDNTVSVGSAGKERQITNVADATQDTDAVNYRQLKEVSGDVTNIKNDVTNIQQGKDGMFQVENSLARAKPTPTGKDSAAGGAGAVASGEASTAMGNGAQATGANATVVGNSAVASATNSSAFGTGAKAQGDRSLAMGANASAAVSNSVAIGSGAQASSANSMALGTGAQASGGNSVALGYGSVADRPNSVSVGAAGQERQITNVADGTQDTDAVNVRQLRDATGEIGSGISNLRNDLRSVERNANAGAASAMAVAGLPQAYAPGRSMASAAASHYLGQSAIALGVSTVSENGRWVYKFAGNVNSQGKVGAVIGAGYQW